MLYSLEVPPAQTKVLYNTILALRPAWRLFLLTVLYFAKAFSFSRYRFCEMM